MPTDEERQRREAVEKRLQAMRRGLVDRAAENELVQQEAAQLDEELRRELGNDGK